MMDIRREFKDKDANKIDKITGVTEEEFEHEMKSALRDKRKVSFDAISFIVLKHMNGMTEEDMHSMCLFFKTAYPESMTSTDVAEIIANNIHNMKRDEQFNFIMTMAFIYESILKKGQR